MEKEYNYILYHRKGGKTVGSISAANEEIARATLNGLVNARVEVEFGRLKEIDYPFEYDWDEKLSAWQSRLC